MSKLLFDEYPILANKTLAKEIELIESILLQQIQYWLELNKQTRKNYRDGRYWTYNLNCRIKNLLIEVIL